MPGPPLTDTNLLTDILIQTNQKYLQLFTLPLRENHIDLLLVSQQLCKAG